MDDGELLADQVAFYRARAPRYDVRRLDDGRQYNVVKVMYEPEELKSQLNGLGWVSAISATRWFLFGSAHPR